MNVVARKMYSFIRFYIARFSKKDPSKPFIFVAIGDSAAEGVGASMPARSYTGVVYTMIKEQFPKAEYYNYAKFGATSKDVIDEQLDKTVALHPDLVTISIGANDINNKVLPKKLEANLRIIIERLQKETSAAIVINNMPDFTKSQAISRVHRAISGIVISRYNKIIEKVAGEYDVFFVNLYKHSQVYAKLYPEVIADDKFHPSDLGHALWANTIINAIENHIFPKQK